MSAVVTIVVVNFNAGEHLPKCVAALKAQTFRDFEVVLVDNASDDDSIARARAEIADDPRFTVHELDANIGFAAGNNRGAANANGKWIATLNPDAFPQPNWLETLIAATRAHPDIAMFGSMQRMADNPDALDGAGDRYFVAGLPWRDRSPARADRALAQGQTTFETFSPCAAAALYRLDVFRDAGGFDEAFFCYVEDVDLGFRLRRRGHDCRQVTNAVVDHVGGGAGGGQRSDFARYHGTRNLIWCFRKNMPTALLVLLLPVHALALILLLCVALLQGSGPAVARGIRDALKGIGDIPRDRLDSSPADARSTALPAFDWTPLGFIRHRLRSER